MSEKEYLNEEQYERSNKKVKFAGIVIMLLGLCLLCGGIYFVVSASQIIEPNMGDDNWFTVSSAKMKTQATGMFMIIPGIFVSLVGLMIRFFIGNRREIMAYQVQQVMPIVKEGTEKMAPTVGKVAKEITKGIKDGLKDEEEG